MSSSPSSEQLGPLVSEHHPRDEIARGYGVLAALSLVGAGAAAAVGLVRWYLAYSHYGPALVWRWSTPAFLMAAGLGVVSLGAVFAAGRVHGLAVRVHENGLVLLRGRRGTWIPWNEIRTVQTSSIRYGLPGFPRQREADLVVEYEKTPSGNPHPTRGPRSVRLPHTLGGMESLGTSVKARVYPLLLEAYSASFNRGQPIEFGRVHLTAEGLRVGKQVFPWKSLSEASLARGELVLRGTPSSGTSLLRIPAHRVPNVELCLQLIQYLGQKA
jgi:hypothetical protein